MKSAIRKNKYWEDVKVSKESKKKGIKRILVPKEALTLKMLNEAMSIVTGKQIGRAHV